MFSPLGLDPYYFWYPLFLCCLIFWIHLFLFFKRKVRSLSLLLKGFKSFFNLIKKRSFLNMRFSNKIISIFFLFFLFKNLWNLIPLNFRASSKIMFTLLFRGTIWIAIKISRILKNFFGFCSHYTTLGSPVFLVSFIKVVEVLRKLIRPITLGVRLAVNLLTGHLFLTMFRKSQFFLGLSLKIIYFFLFFLGIFVFFYEFCVCVIQALVFNLMLRQYFDEHSF